jgi:hypothetical protein
MNQIITAFLLYVNSDVSIDVQTKEIRNSILKSSDDSKNNDIWAQNMI